VVIGASTGLYIAVLRRRLTAARFDASHDPLTGVLNRRTLHESIESEIAGGRFFAAIFVDVDHFKSLNDRFGHDAGDAVLAELARRLIAVGDGVTHVFRLGGDEFVVLTRGSDDHAHVVGQHIWSRVSGDVFALPGGDQVTVSVSVGVAGHRFGIGPAHLLRQADTALARAKEVRWVARWNHGAQVPVIVPRPRIRQRDRRPAAPHPVAEGPVPWRCRFNAAGIAPLAAHALRTSHHHRTDSEDRIGRECGGGLAIIADGGYVTAYSTGFPQPLHDRHDPATVVYSEAVDHDELDIGCRLEAHLHLDERAVDAICHAAEQDGLVEMTVRGDNATFALTRRTGQHRAATRH
jgi:diguanylate cyclase (GGDEF)-like protein